MIDRQVTVRCTRMRKICPGPTFEVSLSALVNGEVKCPECGESWSVHMMAEDGTLLHPTQTCPTCDAPARLDVCRCNYYCRHCLKGHELHTCPTHKVQNPGEGPHDGTRCTCAKET